MSTPKHLAPISIRTQLAEYDAYLASRLTSHMAESGVTVQETPPTGTHRADTTQEARA